MPAKLLYGEEAAAEIRPEIAAKAKALRDAGKPPRLASILVGERSAAKLYVENQRLACQNAGIEYDLRQLPAEVNQAEVLQLIARLNQDAAVHGVILQLPLPGNLDASILQCAITPVKDVEGVHPHNLGLLVYGAMLPAPCTALSAFELIRRARPKLYGQEAVIVGHSRIVGRPLAFMLLHELCTVTICHVATQDLAGHTRHADILVSAVGKANLIAGDMVKPGAIVIDIGINHLPVLDENAQPVLNENGKPKRKVVGDVVFDEVRERAEAITPVPGGVGPLTVNMLLRNLIYATEKQAGVR